MSVRLRLLGGVLAVATLVAVPGVIALRTDDRSARQAAVSTAQTVATGIAFWQVPSAQPGVTTALTSDPPALRKYVARMHRQQDRDIVVVGLDRTILADAEPEDDGTRYRWDTGDHLQLTMADGRPRTFIEHSDDAGPAGIREVVVTLTDPTGVRVGAVIYEYTPLYDEMVVMSARAARTIAVLGALCIIFVLALGAVVAESITRRIRSLTTAVGRVAEGDYTKRVATGSRDEIGQLGTAFNDMAHRLEQSAREILAKEYTDRILANAGEGICGVDAAGFQVAFSPFKGGGRGGRMASPTRRPGGSPDWASTACSTATRPRCCRTPGRPTASWRRPSTGRTVRRSGSPTRSARSSPGSVRSARSSCCVTSPGSGRSNTTCATRPRTTG